jgi:hypothetical protein
VRRRLRFEMSMARKDSGVTACATVAEAVRG